MRQATFLSLLMLTSLSIGDEAAQKAKSQEIRESARSATTLVVLQMADNAYLHQDLLAAKVLYQQALDRKDIAELTGSRARCYDRLIAIAHRTFHHETAVSIWTEQEAVLTRELSRSVLRDRILEVAESYQSLRHYEPARQWFETALAMNNDVPLHPVRVLMARASLARIAEGRSETAKAEELWRSAEKFAADILDRRQLGMTKQDEVQCIFALADGYRFQKRHADAIARLSTLLSKLEQPEDRFNRRDALRMLAQRQADSDQIDPAIAAYRQALSIHRRSSPDDRLVEADLLVELADLLVRRSEHAEAEASRSEAARLYTGFLEAAKEDPSRTLLAVEVFWKLQRVYQQTHRYHDAIKAAENQAKEWAEDSWLLSKLQAETGGMHACIGSYDAAREQLAKAICTMETQSPPNLALLPRAMQGQAIVEQARGELADAEAIGRRCLNLYRKYSLPDDEIAVSVCNLLGVNALLQGKNAQAIDLFRQGVARCNVLGSSAHRQKGAMLLNLAWLHQSQRNLAEALACVEESLRVHQTYSPPDSLGFAWIYCVFATIEADRGRFAETAKWATKAIELCQKHEVSAGMLLVTAQHHLALADLSSGKTAAAADRWRALLNLQGQGGARARTLNYLALAAEMNGQSDAAEKLYREALELQREPSHAFPVSHFISLWRLANLCDQKGLADEAKRTLEQAIEVAESVRTRTYGADQQRAVFFAQFAPAFDQMVDWRVRAGDVDRAFAFAERGRSRGFLDQLRLSGSDPLRGVEGPEAAALRQKAADLQRKIHATRAKAQTAAAGAIDRAESRRLAIELEQAQKEYAAVWVDILHASPVYRSLLAEKLSGSDLWDVRERVLGPHGLMVFYYVGRERGYAFLLGDRSFTPSVYPLSIPKSLADELLDSKGSLALTAGVEGVPNGNVIPVTQDNLRVLVEAYRQKIEDPRWTATRGIQRVRPAAEPAPVATATASQKTLGDILLPPKLRARIKERSPEFVVIVPDGALHKLPFEALTLGDGPTPKFVLDELPPIAYAPSAMVLKMLHERPRRSAPESSLLTVGNPAYPQGKDEQTIAEDRSISAILGFRGQLPLLPYTAAECKKIASFFDPQRVTYLEGEQANEKEVTAALAGRRMVHLAAHGFVDEKHGNLFGAIALAPSKAEDAAADNDGFLSLYEIQSLPLGECELAVLSACVTNVGRQRPLEAGVTIASAFLAAGSRRVVASHWSVDDHSTAELMSRFFQELIAQPGGDTMHYAKALHKARLALRHQQQWQAPFFWSPFVLIGPPNDTAAGETARPVRQARD